MNQDTQNKNKLTSTLNNIIKYTVIFHFVLLCLFFFSLLISFNVDTFMVPLFFLSYLLIAVLWWIQVIRYFVLKPLIKIQNGIELKPVTQVIMYTVMYYIFSFIAFVVYSLIGLSQIF